MYNVQELVGKTLTLHFEWDAERGIWSSKETIRGVRIVYLLHLQRSEHKYFPEKGKANDFVCRVLGIIGNSTPGRNFYRVRVRILGLAS